MRLFGRRFTQRIIAPGSDEVVLAYPIPGGGTLNNVHMDVHVLGAEGVVITAMVAYGLSGFVVPLLDPDAVVTVDSLWDTLIPKDVALSAGAFDLDTAAADATPEYELGLPDLQGLFEMTSHAPMEIFRRRRLITLASSSIGYTTVDAGTDTFTPAEQFSLTVKRNVRVKTPSMALFGFSSPLADINVAVQENTPTEVQWMMLRYLEQTLENAFMSLVGLTEAGAETPYEESMAFVAQLLESNFLESGITAFVEQSWRVIAKATFDITVPGRVAIKTISSE